MHISLGLSRKTRKKLCTHPEVHLARVPRPNTFGFKYIVTCGRCPRLRIELDVRDSLRGMTAGSPEARAHVERINLRLRSLPDNARVGVLKEIAKDMVGVALRAVGRAF